ncbi:MAG: hypothetical protein M3Q76_11220, partial [Acidobacteriota bacterium]|nr:hypothetical protein [Acidobacteriota bacterium]
INLESAPQNFSDTMNRSIEEQLLNPQPSTAAARARDFGIDLTLLIGRLKLTPEERLRELQRAMIEIETMRAGLQRQDGHLHDSSRTDVATADSTSS